MLSYNELSSVRALENTRLEGANNRILDSDGTMSLHQWLHLVQP